MLNEEPVHSQANPASPISNPSKFTTDNLAKPTSHSNKLIKKLIILFTVLLSLVIILCLFTQFLIRPINAPFMCKEEYKICPNGYTKRSGLKCEFSKCSDSKPDLTKYNDNTWNYLSSDSNSYLFKNLIYNYEFEALKSWYFLPLENGFSMVNPDYTTYHKLLDVETPSARGTKIDVFVTKSKTNNIDLWKNDLLNNQNRKNYFKDPETVLIDGITAYKFESKTSALINLYLLHDELEFLFSFNSTEDSLNEGMIVFNQILSTFKFNELSSQDPLIIKIKQVGDTYFMQAPLGSKVTNFDNYSSSIISDSEYRFFLDYGTETICPNATDEDRGQEKYSEIKYLGTNQKDLFVKAEVASLNNSNCLLRYSFNQEKASNLGVKILPDAIIITKIKPNNTFTQNDINTVTTIIDSLKVQN